MTQEEVGAAPQSAALLRRAHELLDHIGKPVTEEQLI